MRYPNLRYGNPTEMAYYSMGVPLADLARRLRRDERTVRDWLSGRQRVPWWVPEILRLKHMEADLRHRQMGFAALAPRLGVVSGDVIALADAKKPQSELRLVGSAPASRPASSNLDLQEPAFDRQPPLEQADAAREQAQRLG